MTRVLLLIKGLGRGGAEQLLVNAAPYLDRDRFTYEVAYVLPWKDALVDDLRRCDLPVHRLGESGGWTWLGHLRRLVRDRGIDLVHAHSPYTAIGARLALVGRHRTAMVYTEHNLWDRYHRATYWANVLTYPRNDHVLAVSSSVAGSVVYPWPLRWRSMPPVEPLIHGPDPNRARTWGDDRGVRDELSIPTDAPVIGTVGNLKGHKDQIQLIRAMAYIRDRVPDARAVLVGDGPERDRLEREARALGVDDRVVLAGFRDDAPRIAATFDVFVLSSAHEGLPISLLEALVLGKPCVVTPVGGIPEVVRHDREALVVPVGDPERLAGALVAVLTDDVLRRRLADAARQRGAAFDITHAVRRSEQVYEEVLGHDDGRTRGHDTALPRRRRGRRARSPAAIAR